VRLAAALAALAAPVALAACSAPEQVCPGEPVAAFRFGAGAEPGGPGWRVAAGDPQIAGLDPVPDVPDCAAAVGYPDALPYFEATLAADASAAALCRRVGIVLYGQHAGGHYVVAGSTDGAVLPGCGATCAAGLQLFVAGDLVLDGAGAPSEFEGLLVEELVRSPGSDCGTCLPDPWQACAARYILLGTR
jgi:hypothetical protein